jgi:hypothetical protein
VSERRHSYLPSWRLILGTAATALVTSISLALSHPATMDVDGQRVVSDVGPVTVGGVAYLPIRAVSEATGVMTSYDAATGTVTLRRGTDVLVVRAGRTRAILNGHAVELKHAPFAVHGRMMVRGADVATLLASNVKYDARRGRIDVRTPGAVVAGVPDGSN